MLHLYLFSTAIFMLTALLNFLTACPHSSRGLTARLFTSSHPYSVHLPNARVNQYFHSFISYTGNLWNSLPVSVFPPAYDLNSFESVNTPLMLTGSPPFASFLVLFSRTSSRWDSMPLKCSYIILIIFPNCFQMVRDLINCCCFFNRKMAGTGGKFTLRMAGNGWVKTKIKIYLPDILFLVKLLKPTNREFT